MPPVFEDPWPKERVNNSLQLAAANHIQLIEIFLKLIPHFKHDNAGGIHDEALAYSEWRYVNYIRYLRRTGVAPHDYPPPWDVAIIWYCHLLSPGKFHRYLWDGGYRDYGLNHHHFPVKRLLDLYNSGTWSDKKAQKKWGLYNMRDDSHKLPFQLWRYPPWQPGRKSKLLSRFSNKQPCMHIKADPAIMMHDVDQLAYCTIMGKREWKLSEWTYLRIGKRQDVCLKHNLHSRDGELCQLTPWPTLDDLRETLNSQIPFWKTVIQAKEGDASFAASLGRSIGDYEQFIKLLGRPAAGTFTSRPVEYDMDTIFRSKSGTHLLRSHCIVPPTLAIDLLWHTHRLYPGSYWVWSFSVARRLIDYEHVTSAAAAQLFLHDTRNEWAKNYSKDCPKDPVMDNLGGDGYVPDAAAVQPGHPAKIKAKFVLGGTNPIRKRKRRTKGEYFVFDGVYVSFDSGDCGGGDGGGGGGGGGGDGGCGGDGGGGGGGGGDGG
ncbi:hypothetical protein Landi51_01206 [Colletotrichum acutatum]